MFDLATIRHMNERAAAPVEDNHSRHCSYAGDLSGGIVLHSAKLRNTLYLGPVGAKNFLRRWNSINSAESRDRLIESYFEGV